jgi:hypothetical protein
MREQTKKELRGLAEIAIGTILGLGILAMIVIRGIDQKKYEKGLQSKRIELVNDLNQDGYSDAFIIRNNGERTPFYGLGTNNTYVSAEQMEKLCPSNLTDWAKIEARLNPKLRNNF